MTSSAYNAVQSPDTTATTKWEYICPNWLHTTKASTAYDHTLATGYFINIRQESIVVQFNEARVGSDRAVEWLEGEAGWSAGPTLANNWTPT